MDIGVLFPIHEEVTKLPDRIAFIKSVLSNREAVEEVIRMHEGPKTNTEHKVLPKETHHGRFTIPCLLEEIFKEEALVDTGSSNDMISLELVRKYGIKRMEKNESLVMLGDSSTKKPIGFIPDYPLKIGNCTIPTDLWVIEMKNPTRFPLILGAPFLATTGARIDFESSIVALNKVDPRVYYYLSLSYDRYLGAIYLEKNKSTGNCNEMSFEEVRMSEVYGWFFDEDDGDPTENVLDGEGKMKQEGSIFYKMIQTFPN